MAKKNSNRDPITGRFLPGNSGGGRKPLPEDLRERFQTAGPEALDTLLAVMRNKKARAADRIHAAEIILDRGWGKPRQAVEIDSSSGRECGVVLLPPRMDDTEDAPRPARDKIKAVG